MMCGKVAKASEQPAGVSKASKPVTLSMVGTGNGHNDVQGFKGYSNASEYRRRSPPLLQNHHGRCSIHLILEREGRNEL
jgi:hypothetical protein